jgi:guanylate kinase
MSGKPKPVVVVTGPSGAGKGTLERMLVERMPELELAVSATTRPQRRGEENGREYWFISLAEFERRAQAGEFLEWVPYVSGQRYGTLRSEIERIQDAGHVPLLDLEIEGALTVRDQVPGAVTIFVDVPAFEELERRLRERATESTGEIGERLALARQQLQKAGEFDYRVVNDEKERAADELEGIVRAELERAATMSPR